MNDQPSNVSNIYNSYMQCIPTTNISKLITKYDIKIKDDISENKENECCGICNDTMILGNDVHTLKCKHKYHLSCITKWFTSLNKSSEHSNSPNKRECPYCRKNGGWLPLLAGQTPICNVHLEYDKQPSEAKLKPKPKKIGAKNKFLYVDMAILPPEESNISEKSNVTPLLCKATTNAGVSCKNRAKYGSYCGIPCHKKQGITTVIDNSSAPTSVTTAS
jgi:hypothetical protein